MNTEIVREIKKEYKTDDVRCLLNTPCLSRVLPRNILFNAYNMKSFVAINRFFLGLNSEDINYPKCKIDLNQTEFPDKISEIAQKQKINEIINDLRLSRVYIDNVNYAPITEKYIKALIELDEVMRLSKYWQKSADSLYRGSIIPLNLNMCMLNSWTTDKSIANFFYSGGFYKTSLPTGFPRINVLDTKLSRFNHENEVLLPPCEFETTKVITKILSSNEKIKGYEVVLRPLNFAKEFLKRMQNPPKDYPKVFLTDPAFGYQKAYKLLEEYIKNYVDKHIIEVDGQIIKELPDPKIVFESEKFEQGKR